MIYRCIVTSGLMVSMIPKAIPIAAENLPPAEMHWSLYGVPEQLDYNATEEVYWEAQKFVILALKANPNVLECLYHPG